MSGAGQRLIGLAVVLATLGSPAAAQWPSPGWRRTPNERLFSSSYREWLYYDYSPTFYLNTYPTRCFATRQHFATKSRVIVRRSRSC